MRIDPDTFNCSYPVWQINVYRRGVEIVRKSMLVTQPGRIRGDRQPIEELSMRSLVGLAFVAANTTVEFLSLMTLTYGLVFPHSGVELKRDLNRFLVQLKRAWGKHDYLWVMEFQDRGAPHIHMVSTLPAPNSRQRDKFAELWLRCSGVVKGSTYCEMPPSRAVKDRWETGWGVHRHPKTWEGLRSVDGGARYIVKYSLKMRQKTVPADFRLCGRFWACSRGVKDGVKSLGTIRASNETAGDILGSLGREDLKKWDILPRQALLFREAADDGEGGFMLK